MKLDKVWAEREAAGDRADAEMKRRTAPTHHENINMRGQFSFSPGQFEGRLIEAPRWSQSSRKREAE